MDINEIHKLYEDYINSFGGEYVIRTGNDSDFDYYVCPHCDSYLIDYSNFCKNCGTKLNWKYKNSVGYKIEPYTFFSKYRAFNRELFNKLDDFSVHIYLTDFISADSEEKTNILNKIEKDMEKLIND